MTLTTVFGILSMNLLTHGIAVLELAVKGPDDKVTGDGYLCTYDGTDVQVDCSPDDFCGRDDVTYEVNFDANDENLYNWYTKLDLVCKDKNATAWIGRLCAIGIFLGVLVIPRIGDLIGRKPMFMGSMILSIPVLAIVSFTKNLTLLYVAVFFAGPAIIGRMACGFLMLMEHMTRPNQAKIGAVIMVFEGLGQVIWVFYLTCISKNTDYFTYFALAINIVTCICLFWVPESPRYLYGINELEKCKETLKYIAAKNGVTNYEAPVFEADYEITVENVDADGTLASRPSNMGPADSKGNKDNSKMDGNENSNFDSLLTERDRTTAAKAGQEEADAER